MSPKKEGEMPMDTIELPTEPGALLGFTKHGQPIFLIAGGAPGDDEGDGDGSDDDATDDASGDGDGDQGDGGADDAGTGDADGQKGDAAGKKPPAAKQTRQPAAQQDADDPAAGLKKALAAERAKAKGLDKELKELRLKHASTEERQLLEAREQAATEAEARVKEPLVRALAASELRAAGVQTGTAKLVGLLDLSKVELDDDGDPIGLTEQIDELREEFPNLFAAAGAGRPPNVNGGAGSKGGRRKDKDGEPDKPKSFAQILADQVTGAAPAGQGMVMR
jgi:hypothetical protein